MFITVSYRVLTGPGAFSVVFLHETSRECKTTPMARHGWSGGLTNPVTSETPCDSPRETDVQWPETIRFYGRFQVDVYGPHMAQELQRCDDFDGFLLTWSIIPHVLL